MSDSSCPICNPHVATPTSAPRPLLDVQSVETQYGITVRMTRRLVEERRIPFVRVGRFVRFRPEHLEAWLDANTVPAVPETRAR